MNGLEEYDPTPKTTKSPRKIILPEFVLYILKEHRTRKIETRLQADLSWEDHDLMFCNANGKFLNPSHLGTDFHELLKKAKLLLIDGRQPQNDAGVAWP